jgi:mannose-6-phosphate isomerase-like protein (cupin superfamily)
MWAGSATSSGRRSTTGRSAQSSFTGAQLQLTVMSLAPGEDIGAEVHDDHDQFLRVERGSARLELGEETHELEDDWAVIVPAGVLHNVVNTGEGELKLYSLYAPPEHPDGTVHRTKAEAESADG